MGLQHLWVRSRNVPGGMNVCASECAIRADENISMTKTEYRAIVLCCLGNPTPVSGDIRIRKSDSRDENLFLFDGHGILRPLLPHHLVVHSWNVRGHDCVKLPTECMGRRDENMFMTRTVKRAIVCFVSLQSDQCITRYKRISKKNVRKDENQRRGTQLKHGRGWPKDL
jgi:hypothetical protein